MRYRLCVVFILIAALFSGYANTALVTSPDLTSDSAETSDTSDSSGTYGTSSPGETPGAANTSETANTVSSAETSDTSNPSETADASDPSGGTDVNTEDKSGESTPGAAIPNETVTEGVAHTIQNITISAIGDILTHDNCLEYVKDGDKYDFDPPFSEVMQVLQSSDLTIANLETTIGGAEAGYATLPGYNGYPKFNTPDSLLDTLKKTGIDVLITANNHCLDRGTAGLVRTIDQLDERGFLHTGTYKTEEDSKKILIADVKGIKIAILAYSYSRNGQPIEEPCAANLIRLDKMLGDVKKAEELKPDLIITYLHMGDEYERQPNSQQKSLADKLIKAGVDIVLENHAHVVQPMERKTVIDDNGQEREGIVIYSLGNFISGIDGPYKDTAVIFNIDIVKDMTTGVTSIKGTRSIPTWLQFYNRDGRDTYRVMTIASAMEKYENKQDSYITEEDYVYLKGRLIEMVDFIENGPEN